MMDHQQRKAEIMRRSRHRIQVRRRIVALCIPLTLCAAVLAVQLLPMPKAMDSTSVDSMSLFGSNEAAPEAAGTGAGIAYAQLADAVYSDNQTISFIQALLELPVSDEAKAVPEDGITLTLTDTMGKQLQYTIADGCLYGPGSQVRVLEDAQFERLLALAQN